MSEITKDLEKLKEKYTEDLDKQSIRAWETEAKRAMLIEDLGNTDSVKLVISELQKELDEIDYLLTNDRNLTDIERSRVFLRKDLYKWFLNLFPEAKTKLGGIRKRIKENL